MLKSMWHTFYMRSLFCVSMVSVFCSVESMLSIHEFAVQNNIESYSFVSLNMFLLFNIATISIIIVLYFLLRGKIKSRNYAEAEEVVRLRETKRSIDEIGLSMDDIKSISCYKNEIKRLSQENANLLNRVEAMERKPCPVISSLEYPSRRKAALMVFSDIGRERVRTLGKT